MNTIPDSTAAVAGAIETIPKFPFLFGAYAVVFGVIFVYVLSIHLRQRRLDREIAALSRRIENR